MDGKHKIPPTRNVNNVSRLPAVARVEPMLRSPTRKSSIDPTKDKFAYFKDNVQDPHDQEEDFDPNMYYYHRPEKDILDHSGAPTPHYPSSNTSAGTTAPFSSSSPVYSAPMQLQGIAGRPVMQMVPNPPQSNNLGPNNNLGPSSNVGPSYPPAANMASGPNASYRFGANGLNNVPITVLGRSGSPAGAVGPMGMAGMGRGNIMNMNTNVMNAGGMNTGMNMNMGMNMGLGMGNQGQGQTGQGGPGSQPRGSMAPTRTSGGNIPTAPAASSSAPPSPMRMVNMNNSGLNNSNGGLGMAGMGVPPMGMNSMVMGAGMPIPGGMSGNMGGMNNGMNMGLAGYAQTLQGMGSKSTLMKDKQGNLTQQQHLQQQQLQQQQQGYEHDQDERDSGHDSDSPAALASHTQPPTSHSQPPPSHPTQAQLLRQSLNGMTAAQAVPPSTDSFDAGFPVLGSRPPAKPEFNPDDFPALPLKASTETEKQDNADLPYTQGFPAQMKSVLSQSSGGVSTGNAPSATGSSLSSSSSSLPLSSSGATSTGTGGSLLQMQQTQKLLQSPLKSSFSSVPPSVPAGGSQANTGFIPDRFGLLGLLSVIRMTDPDLNTLALGTDLTTLGLNLNSPDCLYATFASPFADGPSKREPDFYLPSCYYTQPPMQPASMKIQMFTEETLLYIFYSMPRDILQLHAATELYMRDWRYHKEHKLWFTRVPSTEPLVKTTTYERGSYFYFDPNTWEKIRKDNFVLCYDQIDTPPKP